VKQKFTSGADIYKWSRHLQVEQKFTSGAMIYKWSRDLQVEQTFTSVYKSQSKKRISFYFICELFVVNSHFA
jgi:hypothetical protein